MAALQIGQLVIFFSQVQHNTCKERVESMGILPNGIAEATRLWVQVAQIAIESQMVISLRVAGMMGLLPQHSSESQRMVREKMDAAQEAGTAVMKAVTRGASADQVMAAALRPYGRRTKANARRLTKSSVQRRG